MFKLGDLVSYKLRSSGHTGRAWNKSAHFYQFTGVVEYADNDSVIITYASFSRDGSEYLERTAKFTQRKSGNWIEQGHSEDPKGRNILTHYDLKELTELYEVDPSLTIAAKKLGLNLVSIIKNNLQGEINRSLDYIQKVQSDQDYNDLHKQKVADWTNRDIQKYKEKLNKLEAA